MSSVIVSSCYAVVVVSPVSMIAKFAKVSQQLLVFYYLVSVCASYFLFIVCNGTIVFGCTDNQDLSGPCVFCFPNKKQEQAGGEEVRLHCRSHGAVVCDSHFKRKYFLPFIWHAQFTSSNLALASINRGSSCKSSCQLPLKVRNAAHVSFKMLQCQLTLSLTLLCWHCEMCNRLYLSMSQLFGSKI